MTLQRLHSTVRPLGEWVRELLRSSHPQSRPVDEFGFQRLANHFPPDLLSEARVVVVERVPFPPVEDLGLPELSGLGQLPLAGITYLDMFFLEQSAVEESVFFHELIHVVQWRRLGLERFLLAYGAGLLQFGYRRSPLEEMAYDLQGTFDRRNVVVDLIAEINRQTDAVWEDAVLYLEGRSG